MMDKYGLQTQWSVMYCLFVPCSSHKPMSSFFFFFNLGWADTVPTGIANSNVRIVRIFYR